MLARRSSWCVVSVMFRVTSKSNDSVDDKDRRAWRPGCQKQSRVVVSTSACASRIVLTVQSELPLCLHGEQSADLASVNSQLTGVGR